MRKPFVLAVAIVAALLGLLAGCGGSEEVAVDEGAVVIDVRTPEEYAAGHLDGAVNIDLSAPDFAARIDALDPDESYVVYCHSGNRSAQATAIMRDAGFDDVLDAGGIDDAAESTGRSVVTD